MSEYKPPKPWERHAMTPPEPWEIGAFPAQCPICTEVHWYRPDDTVGHSPCNDAISLHTRILGYSAPHRWWVALVEKTRKDLAAEIEAKVRAEIAEQMSAAAVPDPER